MCIMGDVVKLSTERLISWFGIHSVDSRPVYVFGQRYFTLLHKNLDVALEVLLQEGMITFKIRLCTS